jgi:hypothetical protein
LWKQRFVFWRYDRHGALLEIKWRNHRWLMVLI